MKRLILVLSLLLPVAGQVEPPALGTFVDREGQLRKLFGVSGSLIPGPPLATGVLTCGSSGERTVWKTVDRVFLSAGKEEATRSWDAPAGPARFRFAPEGLRIWFESGETGWTWRSDLDDFVPAGWLTKDDFPNGEPVGEWTLFRTEQGLRVQRGDTILAVPEAAADTPKLYEIVGTGEIPISGPIVFATVGPGDSQTKRFRIRNEGVDALTINRLSVSGGGDFAITDGFTPPRIIAAGRFDDFWLRFAPQSPGARNGTLFVNTTTFEVQGSAPTWASLQATDGDGWVTLSTSKVFDLGSVERGSELRRTFRFINLNAEAVAVPAVAVSGSGFVVQQGWTDAQSLQPGESAGFDVVFLAAAAGAFQGTIEAGAQKFLLSATAREYPLPKPTISFPTSLESARQEKLKVTFVDLPRTAGTGLVKLDFQPTPGLPDDPTAIFPANGTRTATFRVADGNAAADFSGQDGILVQSGTTTGTLVVTVTLGTFVEVSKIEIKPATIMVDSAQGLRADLRIDVRFSAFDNTHQASQVAFTFYQKNGQPVQPGRMIADISQLMKGYFTDNPRVGGIFSVRASFPVTGTATEIDRVDVEIVNPAGTTKLDPIKF